MSNDLLNEIEEFLEDHQDVVDGPYGEQSPNRAMSLLIRLQEERRIGAPKKRKVLGFAAAVREYGDDWVHSGFAWNGESYRGMSAATVIAMQDSRGPGDHEAYVMRNCRRFGRGFYAG